MNSLKIHSALASIFLFEATSQLKYSVQSWFKIYYKEFTFGISCQPMLAINK